MSTFLNIFNTELGAEEAILICATPWKLWILSFKTNYVFSSFWHHPQTWLEGQTSQHPSEKSTFSATWNFFGDMKSTFRRHEINFWRHEIHIPDMKFIFPTWNSFPDMKSLFAPTWVNFRRHEIFCGDMKSFSRRHEIPSATWNFIADMKFLRRHEIMFSATWNGFVSDMRFFLATWNFHFLQMNTRVSVGQYKHSWPSG